MIHPAVPLRTNNEATSVAQSANKLECAGVRSIGPIVDRGEWGDCGRFAGAKRVFVFDFCFETHPLMHGIRPFKGLVFSVHLALRLGLGS